MSGSVVRQRLVETAMALTEEFPSQPAGSVLRCYARAATLSRIRGCPAEELPDEARRTAALLLAERAAGGMADRLPLGVAAATLARPVDR